MNSPKNALLGLALSALLCAGGPQTAFAENAAPSSLAGNYVLPEKTACADAGVSRETFDFGWKFAKFGKHADCLAPREPGAPVSAAIASSEEAHNPAPLAVDGNESSRWCASGRHAASLTVDLGRACAIGDVQIVWERNAKYPYAIAVSDDGKTWETVVDRKENARPAKKSRETLGRTFRYAKIDVSPAGTAWPSICEWTFFDGNGAVVRPELRGKKAGLKAFEPAFDDSGWRALDLPHDWGVESRFLPSEPNQAGSLPWNAVGWYRKEFSVPADKAGKKFFLDFDGVMMMPQVYVNGKLAGEWKYGYSSFRVDITPFLNFGGNNVVAVRAENLPNSTRWYPGAGIYRHVWLVEKNPVAVAYNGVWVRTPEISGIRADGGTPIPRRFPSPMKF